MEEGGAGPSDVKRVEVRRDRWRQIRASWREFERDLAGLMRSRNEIKCTMWKIFEPSVRTGGNEKWRSEIETLWNMYEERVV